MEPCSKVPATADQSILNMLYTSYVLGVFYC